jgi:molybdopterin converting factor small subunit
MKVTVKLGEPLKSAVGQRTVALELGEGATVADALSALAVGYPGFQERFYRHEGDNPYLLFLNDDQVKLEESSGRPLGEGDRLFIFLPVAGGTAAKIGTGVL